MKRIGAYLCLFIAGNTNALLALGLFGNAGDLADLVHHPQWKTLSFVILPGVAAVIAAWMARAPFLHAVRTRRRAGVYGWTVLGVIAAHAVYAVLIAWETVLSGEAASEALFGAGIVFEMSMILGFLPNLLVGLCFAEAVLGLGRKRRVIQAG